MAMKPFLKLIRIIILILIVLIIIVLIGGFIFLKNFDVEKYKPQIIQAASQAFGRPVDFRNIDLKVSLRKGIRFHLTDFSVAENPAFGVGDFIAVEEIAFGVDLFSFFVFRKISVPSVYVLSPRISIVRNAEGALNIQTIGQDLQGSSQGKKPVSYPVGALPALLVNSLRIENAQISLIDKTIQPELKLAVTQASLNVQRFSFIRPFNVFFEAAVLSSRKNLDLAGTVQLKLNTQEARISDTEIAIDLNHLPLDELRAFPLLSGIPLPQVLEGELNFKVKEATVSDKGLGKINVSVVLANGKVIASEIVPGVLFEANHVDFGLQNFSLDGVVPSSISLKAALYQEQPNVDFTGMVSFDSKTGEIHLTEGQFETDLAAWPLKKIKSEIGPLKDVLLPEQLFGKLQMAIKDAVVSASGLKTILLDVALKNGELTLNNIIPGTSLELGNTDVSIKNFSLGKPFSISIKAAYLTETQNITFDGMVSCDLNAQSAVIKDGASSIDLDGFPWEQFRSSGFVPKETPLPKVLTGKINVKLDHLSASPRGLGLGNLDLKWQDGRIQMDEIVPGISFAANAINVDVKDFSLDNDFGVTGSLGYENEEPNVSFDGKMGFNPESQNIRLSNTVIRANLTKIPFNLLKTKIQPLKDIPFPEILKGQLEVNIKELSAGPHGVDSVLADAALKEGEVSMKEIAPGISFAASHISADISSFGLESPFGFDVRLAYLSSVPNIHAKAMVQFHGEDQRVILEDAQVQADIATVSMDSLRGSAVSLKEVALPERLKGDLSVSISHADVGPKGLTALSGSGSLKNWEVTLKELAVPIRGLDTSFKITESLFSIDDLQVLLGKGQITAKVGVTDYMTRQNFDFTGIAKGINLAEILDQKDAPIRVEGVFFGNIKAQGAAADLNSVTGEGDFEVKEARLKDLNVLKTVLDKISFLPNVSSRVEAKLSEKYRQKFKDKDTEIKKITALCGITSGEIVLDPISIEADEFIFSGSCRVGFDQKYALDGKVRIPMELSAAMGDGINELTYLYDKSSNISLPVHVTGKGAQMPVVAVTQTAIDMGKNVMRNEGKKQLEKVLNKLLGASEQTSSSGVQNQEQNATSQEQKSPGAQIVDDIFDKIFK